MRYGNTPFASGDPGLLCGEAVGGFLVLFFRCSASESEGVNS